ncbi:hypothetical protein EVAR_5295_1 [Eumeta japonica]|uniref:Uncharacterized protein n=1 Tax=Eumeta variegata TaxID=151549 RepID=A0A4C1TMS5_EUMVA|nr:hypothetical protein EVAR_5295_1 [Eumeta japonica]
MTHGYCGSIVGRIPQDGRAYQRGSETAYDRYRYRRRAGNRYNRYLSTPHSYVTFANKTATGMRNRIETRTGNSTENGARIRFENGTRTKVENETGRRRMWGQHKNQERYWDRNRKRNGIDTGIDRYKR